MGKKSPQPSWPILGALVASVRTGWQNLTERIRRRPDSEAEQAIIRVILGATACLYMLSVDFADTEAVARRVIAWDAFLFLSAALTLLVGVLASDKASPSRRYAGIVLDMAATSLAVAFGGEAAAPLLAVYLWVIVGNGFRYGDRYLAFAIVAALVGLSTALLYAPFWREHMLFGTSFIVVLILIPAYLAALLRKLRVAMKQADDANLAKSRFLAKMSHELRTPLNGIIGVADLLRVSTLGERERELVATVQASSGTLLSLIDDILDFSRIESGHLEIEVERFAIRRFVEETLSMLRPQATGKGLELTHRIDARIPKTLIGDPRHLRQILVNLVANAVKFTDAGSVHVVVKLGAEQDDASAMRIRFEVFDTGCGIAPEEQNLIFDSFHQAAHQQDMHVGGIGLGTAIAKELTQRMGGQIGLRSECGKGSAFWFEVPFEVVSAADLGTAEELRDAHVIVAGSGKHVLALLHQLKAFAIRPAVSLSVGDAADQIVRAPVKQQAYTILLVFEQDFDRRALEAFGLLGNGIVRFLLRTSKVAEPTTLDGFRRALQWPLEADDLVTVLQDCHNAAQPQGENVIAFSDYYRSLSPQENARLRILVAEDNDTNRRILEAILEQAGHHVVQVGDGEAALDLVTESDFDLMILDQRMPKRSGLEVFKAQRFMQSRPPTPTIILSADATKEAMQTCLDAGVDAYLTKPVATYKLLETIARLSRRPSAAPSPGTSATAGGRERESAAAPVLDEERLRSLRALGAGPGEARFLQGLLVDFRRDAQRAVSAVAHALSEQDYPALRAALHALEGSAQQLGALGILRSVNQLKELKHFELGSSRAETHLAELRAAVGRTAQLLSSSIVAAGEDQPL
jgi:two-component system sensor histidine kinase RpfC